MSDETKALKVYRGYLTREIFRPEIEEQKASFVQHYFISESLPWLQANFLVPALAYLFHVFKAEPES